MRDYLQQLLNLLKSGANEDEILKALAKDERFSHLKVQTVSSTEGEPGERFNTDTKSAAFLRDALKEPLRCAICGGLIHFSSISIDRIKRREDGGLGTVDNAQLAHPFCNTTIKN
jgi:hypothetical protein